ncbi:MAG: NADH-quinone oxidoreductase subunit C [Rhodospirillaceae bacterium]
MAPPLSLDIIPVAGAAPAGRARVDAPGWRAVCEHVAADGGRLIALWGSDDGASLYAHAALAASGGLLWTTLAGGEYPDISDLFPAANRMQRAAHDLVGVAAVQFSDRRPWLRHGAWPEDAYPLRKRFSADAVYNNAGDGYRFVQVAGDGVHEIPVGPVHAGTIEPGHFRFSVIGERVLRLEERLGYKHKGIEKRFEQLGLMDAARLAGRVSGDSTVAYAWAYAMAVEAACGVEPSARALWLRALLLERERIANHLGDLGFLGNDAGLAFGLAQFSRLKEDVLRANLAMFGHRFLMDVVVPGGVARDLSSADLARMRRECDALESEVTLLRGIYEEHAGLQDRFIACGTVTRELATQLGLTGLAGRASAQAWDVRVQFPHAPYDELAAQMVLHDKGDVAARVSVRFDEIFESLRLMRAIADRLPSGEIWQPLPVLDRAASGVGWVEGWRGDVFIALEALPGNAIQRLHPHDPSWQNWPVLEHAILGNIVPDFPLINKSFNLSYAGHDL